MRKSLVYVRLSMALNILTRRNRNYALGYEALVRNSEKRTTRNEFANKAIKY